MLQMRIVVGTMIVCVRDDGGGGGGNCSIENV